ncbi:hypothetical protein BGZ98_009643 [Dissophora globulifera]|nr:hypothetical protein BGZ98_009643 [Dissophora globulifera]
MAFARVSVYFTAFAAAIAALCVDAAAIAPNNEPAITNIVYLTIEVNRVPIGNITIGLFGDVMPKTARNFVELTEGSRGYSLVGSTFHKAVPNFLVSGGKIEAGQTNDSVAGRENNDAKRGKDGEIGILDNKLRPAFDFRKESSDLKHSAPGLVSMLDPEHDKLGSQFIITAASAPFLDGQLAVFGMVIDGMKVVRTIEALPTDSNHTPIAPVRIVSVGGIQLAKNTHREL